MSDPTVKRTDASPVVHGGEDVNDVVNALEETAQSW